LVKCGWCQPNSCFHILGFRNRALKPNGPAILGDCVTRRQHRAESLYFSRKFLPVQGGGVCPDEAKRRRGRAFLLSWYKVNGVLARSRYKLSRSRKFITMQNKNCVQMSESGCMNHYRFVLGAGAIKNRYKLIDPTVRVISSFYFFIYTCFNFLWQY